MIREKGTMLCIIKPQISLSDSDCKTLIGCRTTIYCSLFFFFFFHGVFLFTASFRENRLKIASYAVVRTVVFDSVRTCGENRAVFDSVRTCGENGSVFDSVRTQLFLLCAFPWRQKCPIKILHFQ